jgi:siroheme synthase-like protein
VGGGKVGGRKAYGLLGSGAEVVVISPEIGEIPEGCEILVRQYRYGDLEGAALAFAATDVREVNAAVVREARERGIPVSVADEPSEGDFSLPSTLRRGRLQVAVSTGGASPSLARSIRLELEELFGEEWAGLVEEAAGSRYRRGDFEEVLDRCLSRLRG